MMWWSDHTDADQSEPCRRRGWTDAAGPLLDSEEEKAAVWWLQLFSHQTFSSEHKQFNFLEMKGIKSKEFLVTWFSFP